MKKETNRIIGIILINLNILTIIISALTSNITGLTLSGILITIGVILFLDNTSIDIYF